jgi:hypothetical protein
MVTKQRFEESFFSLEVPFQSTERIPKQPSRFKMIINLLSNVVHCPMFLAEVIFGSISLLMLGVILYRMTLHPLAKYPGPFFAKFTDLYLAYHAWRGDRHLIFWQAHENYGKCRFFDS